MVLWNIHKQGVSEQNGWVVPKTRLDTRTHLNETPVGGAELTNGSRRKRRLRRVARFLGFALLIICAIRIGFWHVENDIREAAYRHALAISTTTEANGKSVSSVSGMDVHLTVPAFRS